MHRRTNVKETRLRCRECGMELTIWRRRAKMKSAGHVKHMWCPTCQEVTAFIEGRG